MKAHRTALLHQCTDGDVDGYKKWLGMLPAPALSSRTTSHPYLNFQAPYPRSEQDSAMDEQLTTLLGLPLEDLSHLFGVPIPVSRDSLDAVDSGTTMPASDGSQEFGSSDSDMDLFAAMFSDLPPSSPPQEWPLTLPPVPKPSPAVAPAPDTPLAATRRRKRDEVDPNDI
ncbi:hypothetical protein B0H12DRAFT_1238846 [Mycena haematopus]|nr:hypothetical protein B0H12DRAFT_1238846 [Mycena haematopus]